MAVILDPPEKKTGKQQDKTDGATHWGVDHVLPPRALLLVLCLNSPFGRAAIIRHTAVTGQALSM
eukprot:COSAG05_NODE_882_length_6789_cov_6.646487_2_plen_65_part_00